jgi:hypothetical protein
MVNLMDPADQLRALGGASTVLQLLSSKRSSQQKLAACVLARCLSNPPVQELQKHAAALVQQILTTSDREVRLRLLYAAASLKDCVLLDISETWLIDALKLVLADQDEDAAIAVCYLLMAQLNNNAAIAQLAAKADVGAPLFSMTATGSPTCKATALATLCTLLRVSYHARVLLLPEQIELLLVSALDTAATDQLGAKTSTNVANAATATRRSCAALAARCLLCSLSLDDSASDGAVAAVRHIRSQLRLLKAAQRLLHCLSSHSSAQELAVIALTDALSAPLQRAASASTSAASRPASSRAASRRSSRELTSDTPSTVINNAAEQDSIAAVLCNDGALRTLVWLLHSKSSAVATAARTAVLALLQHHTHSVCAVVEQGCVPLLLMPCSSATGTAAATTTAAAEMAAVLQCLRSKLCDGELHRLLQTVKAPGNRELRSNVACGLVLLFDNSTASASLQQDFVSDGALQAVVGMLRSSLYRPTGAAVLRLLAARTATLQPPVDYFSAAAAAGAASAVAAGSTDATVLILDDKTASSGSSSSSSSSDSSSGIRMACPSAAVLQLVSPALGRALAAAAAAAAAATSISTSSETTTHDTSSGKAVDSLLLPLLRGRYAAWEDIMAHIGAPAAAAAAVTRLSVPQLKELFALTNAHGAAALANSYALELARRQQSLKQQQPQQQQQQQQAVGVVATAAVQRTAVLELVGVLDVAMQRGHAWLCSEALKWLIAALGESGQHCAGTPLQLNRLVTVLYSALTVLLTSEQTQQ